MIKPRVSAPELVARAKRILARVRAVHRAEGCDSCRSSNVELSGS